jgi:hypothetical protein
MIFTKVNLVGYTCMYDFKLQNNAQRPGLNKRKEFGFEIQTLQYLINKSCKNFIQAFEIHSELLFKHCSCYSDARGVIQYFGVDNSYKSWLRLTILKYHNSYEFSFFSNSKAVKVN